MNDSPLSDSIFGEDESGSAAGHGDRSDQREQAGTQRSTPPHAPGDETSSDPQAPSRRSRRHERGRAPRRRAWMSCLVVVLVFAAAVGGGLYVLRDHLPQLGSNAPTDYTGSGSGSVTVTVERGDTGYLIGRRLEQAGVVKSANTFANIATHSRAFTDIEPGTYRLHKHMSSQAAITLMLDPKALISRGTVIREGLWTSEIFAALSKATGIPVSAYRKVDPKTLGLPAAAHGNLEGYLFPSTYTFSKHETAAEQLREMVTLGNKKRASLHIPAGTLHHVMTVASLVQAESRLGPDGPKVARVVENRLQKGMKLQMDSTVHFAEKKRGTVTTSDKERASKSPYNTYRNKGLPPGPIDNPGLAAIKAALHPAHGSWLYFVTVDQSTGKTLFASTYTQQQKNEKKFHAWCKAHQGKC